MKFYALLEQTMTHTTVKFGVLCLHREPAVRENVESIERGLRFSAQVYDFPGISGGFLIMRFLRFLEISRRFPLDFRISRISDLRFLEKNLEFYDGDLKNGHLI